MRIAVLVLYTSLFSLTASAADQVRLLPRQMKVTATFVEGSGSWVLTTKAVNPPIPLPLINATNFKCSRLAKSCTEATAALFTTSDDPRARGQSLLSSLSEYAVTSWTATRIVAIARHPVADVTLEIDLVNKSAIRRHQETRERGNQSADPAFRLEWALR